MLITVCAAPIPSEDVPVSIHEHCCVSHSDIQQTIQLTSYYGCLTINQFPTVNSFQNVRPVSDFIAHYIYTTQAMPTMELDH